MYKDRFNFRLPLLSLNSFLKMHDQLLTSSDPIIQCSVLLLRMKKIKTKESFIDFLMNVLNVTDRKSISMSSTFSQLGIDSLAGIELQQMVHREYGVSLTPIEIREMSIIELETKIMNEAKIVE